MGNYRGRLTYCDTQTMYSFYGENCVGATIGTVAITREHLETSASFPIYLDDIQGDDRQEDDHFDCLGVQEVLTVRG